MKKYRGSYIVVPSAVAEPARREIEQVQRMHLLGTLAMVGGELLSYHRATQLYGAARVDYLIQVGLIKGVKDPSSRNGQVKYLRGDIDAVIFSNYHEGLGELHELYTSLRPR